MPRFGNPNEESMTDRARLEQLILASHPCVIVNTTEEDYILKLLREIAIESSREMLQWTITDGLCDSIVAESKPIPETDHPAAALFHLAHNVTAPILCAMLDLPGHLKDERTLRLLR